MGVSESLYNRLVAEGDDPDAPRRVHVEHRGDRAIVTLDEPDRLNVLSAPLVRQLRCAIETLVVDRGTRSVVLTGRDPGFSAGGDLTMMQTATANLSRPEGAGLGAELRPRRRQRACRDRAGVRTPGSASRGRHQLGADPATGISRRTGLLPAR